MKRSIHIVSTKRLSEEQKKLFSDSDILLTDKDFIEITQKELPAEISLKTHLLFTSKNAVMSVVEKSLAQLISFPVFCVGSETRKLLERYGFEVIASADYAKDLAELILEKHPDVSITFFSGNLRYDTLPERLQSQGILMNEYEVYETHLHPIKVISEADGILFFSPSAVNSFLQNNSLQSQTCFCIGTTTATALENITHNIEIADKPTIKNVLLQCIKHYQ